MFKTGFYRSVFHIFILLAVLVMPLSTFNTAPVSAADSNTEMGIPGSNAIQFSSAGHVLDFSSDRVMIASADHILKIGFINANPAKPQSDTDGGRDFSRVTYNSLWKGVNLVYTASAGLILKSTYYVAPDEIDRSIDQIRLQYNRPIKLDASGNLVTSFDTGSITESKPVAWQEISGQKIEVQASYWIYSDNEVGFKVDNYLPGLALVIDPSLTWNTFLGGTGVDEAAAVVADNNGNVYVTGVSTATWGASPKRAYTGMRDAFVAKLDSGGNLTWNTFLGAAGSDDRGRGIAIDTSGNVYVTGESTATWGTSPKRPYTGGADMFAAQLDIGGDLTWNTFLGGAGTDIGYGIALDSNNNVYVYGDCTAAWGASPKRGYSGGLDSCAIKLDNSGVLQWFTFIGGAGSDGGYAIAVDATGVYTCGYSDANWGASPKRPYTGNCDAYVTKLDITDGSFIWNTFLGGSGLEIAYGIAVSSGKVYVTGYSYATWGSPVQPFTGSDSNMFVAKLDSNGDLNWNTFQGSTQYVMGLGIAVDASGYVYATGYSAATWGSPSPAFGGGSSDGFVAKYDNSGHLNWNAFVGGGSNDRCEGIALDGSGNLIVCGYSTSTWGASPKRAYTSSSDGFAVKLTNPTNSSSSSGARMGGEFFQVDRLAAIAPWLSLAIILMLGGTTLAFKFRKRS